MEDPPAMLAAPQKRTFEEAEDPVSTPTKPPSSSASTPLTVLSTLQTPSPFKNTISQTSPPASSNNSVAGDIPAPTQPSGSTQQPAKRRKITPQEKEQQRLEKEARDKARSEKKAQKEAEDKLKADQKARKDEEKQAKDEEKRKKNEEREEKKRAKEFELQQKEEEKRKKERSQMRLNAFFVKPKPSGEDSGKALVDAAQTFTEPASLTPDIPMPDANLNPPSPQKAIQKNARSDYERYFLPFSLPSHAILAPYNNYMKDPAKLAAASARLDRIIEQKDVDMEPAPYDYFKRRGTRGLDHASVLEIVEQINGCSDHPIDLTSDSGAKEPLEMLKKIPMKYLRFPEDVRPPYYGTYTKPHTPRESASLARNPFTRKLPELDYDYDSEAEWEEPEEGEDLDSDGDDDMQVDDEGEDDMEGFLDDEEDAQIKRRLLSGDLQPLSTGLCWEDSQGVSRLNDGSGAISTEFKEFKMGFLLEPSPRAIDPLSNTYWAPEPTLVAAPIKAMNPPRLPLAQRPANGMLNTLNASQHPVMTAATSKATKPHPPKRQIPADQLTAFKAEVNGSDLTKIALIEALKKKFPKLPKDAISNTLTAVAARVGPSQLEKRWMLL
ncbi:chromatin assembly factor 1 subunit A-domain-containing protein [Massariosphaeria phaeospora]|uniref:Chromatin assembly factor 1 subunit A-domain-containing protein n=1 Tax=Massariosphaeria phaeospora TaxID=100035 RepID=A0A7C8MK72_9PLEO|nr:chromatin assembly factor 1 subunit A-domain-containing protein [Massariosphaeria phaeospora]